MFLCVAFIINYNKLFGNFVQISVSMFFLSLVGNLCADSILWVKLPGWRSLN